MNIKRIFVFILACVLLSVCLVSCKKDVDESATGETAPEMCTIKFNSNCNIVIEPKNIVKGEKIGEPEEPVYEGFVFDGWYNKANNLKWDFAFDKVAGDMTLYAKWLEPKDVFKFQQIDDETAEITGVLKEAQYLQIPSEIGGYAVTGIADNAFSKSSSEIYKKITIPESVTIIGERAFEGCAGIEIVVEGALRRVGEWAFDGCTGLKSVTFDENVELIAPESFQSTGLTFVYIPESVQAIEENAFSDCADLQRVILHAKNISILDSAFRDSGIKAVYFYGEEDEVDALFDERVEPFNDSFVNAFVYIYSETEPEIDTGYDGFWYFDGKGQTRIWP
ncbi:MAG: hypothetical protein E7607_00045 [Ruminococcaceae bacterium]|nr:hypothetical protein [Oscillospiraceae bacterium]